MVQVFVVNGSNICCETIFALTPNVTAVDNAFTSDFQIEVAGGVKSSSEASSGTFLRNNRYFYMCQVSCYKVLQTSGFSSPN